MQFFWVKAIGCILIVNCYCQWANAQWNVPKHEAGISAGMFIYQGDITPEKAGAFKSSGLAFNIFYNQLLTPSFSLRTNLAIGKMSADDANYDHPAYRQQRNFRFNARTIEVAELLVWNIRGNNYGEKGRLSPYVFGGAGLSFLRINRDWSRFNAEYFTSESSLQTGLGIDTSHALPRVAPVIPLGGGIRYAISPRLSLMAEASYRIMFTDYLDGFSYAANPDKKDRYSNYSVGLIYTWGRTNTLKCPVIRY